MKEQFSHSKPKDGDTISVRIPIFNQNKPYVFIKIAKSSDKFRLSLSPDFLKQFNLSFRIFRNRSLNDLLESLPETSRLNSNFNKLDFRLPKKEAQEVNKLKYIFDINDDNNDILDIEKYTFLDGPTEKTIVLIMERTIGTTKNTCIAFISKEFLTFEAFLKDLDLK